MRVEEVWEGEKLRRQNGSITMNGADDMLRTDSTVRVLIGMEYG